MTSINPEHAKADALARFTDPGPDKINCAQSVLRFALLVSELDTRLVTAARYFGGGIARTGETCGALTGAALALGLRDQHAAVDDLDRAASDTRKMYDLLRHFAAEFGSPRCLELTGYDLSTPEGYKLFRESGRHERCVDYVGWVCDRLNPLLS